MRLIGEKREGEVSITSRGGGMVTIDETWHYIVEADSKTDERLVVSRCQGLPIVGSTTSAGGLAVCKSKVGTRRADNPLIWDFTCSFSSEVEEDSDQSQQAPGSDPTTWVPVRKTMFERREYVSFTDKDGTPVLTSAGQPYDTGIVLSRFLPVWEFTQFESATVTDEIMLSRNEVVNASTFKGKAAKTLLCIVVDSTLGFYYGQRRRLSTYRLIYDSKDWRLKRLDVGTIYKNGSGVPKNYIVQGQVIMGPLNGTNGQPAGGFDANGLPDMDGTPPGLRYFDIYATDSFAFLRI